MFESAPLYETHEIEFGGGACLVTVAQATESDMVQRRAMIPANGKTINARRMIRREAYLTLSSVADLMDGNGKEMFPSAEGTCGVRVRYAMSESDFNHAWNALPRELCDQIYGAVESVNFHWSMPHKLIEHLDRLRSEITAWHEYEDQLAQGKQAELQANAELLGLSLPQQPEPLSEYRSLERLNFAHLIYPGGLHAQPHIYMLELRTCATAEREHERLQQINQALKRPLPPVLH